MKDDSVIEMASSIEAVVHDGLTSFIREQAQKMLGIAVAAEVDNCILQHSKLLTNCGNKRVVRNGYLPSRAVQTGVGNIEVKMPRVRDQEPEGKLLHLI